MVFFNFTQFLYIRSSSASDSMIHRDTVIPPEIPLRRHYSHYHERGHAYPRRDQPAHPIIRQSSQGHEHISAPNSGQAYPGRHDAPGTNAPMNNKHATQQVGQQRSTASVAANQGSRFHYERPLRSPFASKDIPKEFPSPVHQQPIKEYRDQVSAVQMSPARTRGQVGIP